MKIGMKALLKHVNIVIVDIGIGFQNIVQRIVVQYTLVVDI